MTVARGSRGAEYRSIRVPQYRLDHRLSARLGEFEVAMLEGLKAFWRCNTSEAIRRSVVYTFCRMVAGVERFDEESIMRALQLALDIYRRARSGTSDSRDRGP
jgi:hypothetical protein